MSNRQLATHGAGKPALQKDKFLRDSLSSLKEQAGLFLDSGMIPDHWVGKRVNGQFQKFEEKKAIARLAIAFQAGQEAGLRSYRECLSYMYVVNNLPTIYGSGNNILIQRNPSYRGVVTNAWDPKKKEWVLTVKVSIHGSISEVTTTFSEQDAVDSGLKSRNKNYEKFMKQMAERKCWARMYQIHFPGGIDSFEYMDHEPEVQGEWQDVSGEWDPSIMEGKSREELIQMSLDNPDVADEINQFIANVDKAAARLNDQLKAAIKEDPIETVEAEEVQEVEETEETPEVFKNLQSMMKWGSEGKFANGKKVGFQYVTEEEVNYGLELLSKQDVSECESMVSHLKTRYSVIKGYDKDILPQIVSKDGPGLEITDYATGEQAYLFEAEA